MCDCNLLREGFVEPIDIPERKFRFVLEFDGKRHVPLDNFHLSGVVDYASVSAITEGHGVKRGYMFIMGESQ